MSVISYVLNRKFILHRALGYEINFKRKKRSICSQLRQRASGGVVVVHVATNNKEGSISRDS